MVVWRQVGKSAQRPPSQRTEPAGRTVPVSPVSPDLGPRSPEEVLALQRTLGNQATSDLLARRGPGARSEVAPPARTQGTSTGSKRQLEEPTAPPPRRSARLAAEYDLDKPTLSFNSRYTGARTQKLNEAQEFMFDQQARLARPNGAPQSVETYYEFRQEVRDGYESEGSTAQALGTAFVQDGPYRPNYNDEMIDNAPGAITFQDTPGFSHDRRIPVREWLNWYKVFFRWRVKRKETNKEWVSPEVGHSVEAPYDEDKDVAVNARAAGDRQWPVDLSRL
jgi:hypothetical protein